MALNSNALTDLATAKSYLDIPSGNTDQDANVERLINAVSDMFERYTSRKLVQQTITEYQDGRTTRSILLKEYPALKPSALYISNDWIFDSTTLVDPAEYDIFQGLEVRFKNKLFDSGTRNIKIVYAGGYNPLPADLVEAALMMVQYLYVQRSDRRLGKDTISKNGESIKFVQGIPTFITTILEPYVNCDLPLLNAPVANS
jgi:hypothetical protein